MATRPELAWMLAIRRSSGIDMDEASEPRINPLLSVVQVARVGGIHRVVVVIDDEPI